MLTSQELADFLNLSAKRFPASHPLVLLLADTGAQIGEALALRWSDVDLVRRVAWIRRSFSNGQYLGPTKTGQEREIELSGCLAEALVAIGPDVFGDDALVFASREGTLLDPNNFRDRVFRKLADEAFGKTRRFAPHGLRHTFASLHLARGTPIKWIQSRGGWASAKLVLDLYGHFLPSDYRGFADAIEAATATRPMAPTAPQTHPPAAARAAPRRTVLKSPRTAGGWMAPRAGLEPATRRLTADCSTG